MRYDWIKKIEDLDKATTKELDYEITCLIEIVGVEKFIEVFKLLEKLPYYFSYKKLTPLIRCYILQEIDKKSVTEIAREIGVGARMVNKIIKDTLGAH